MQADTAGSRCDNEPARVLGTAVKMWPLPTSWLREVHVHVEGEVLWQPQFYQNLQPRKDRDLLAPSENCVRELRPRTASETALAPTRLASSFAGMALGG